MMKPSPEFVNRVQYHLNRIKEVFLNHDFDDHRDGWIVEDHIHAIQQLINDDRNAMFKASEPDPFALPQEEGEFDTGFRVLASYKSELMVEDPNGNVSRYRLVTDIDSEVE